MADLKLITVPLDGSTFAEQALPMALRLARSTGGALRLVMVHAPATTWDPGVEFSLFDPDVEQQLREREAAYLEQIARRLTADDGPAVQCAVLEGSTAEALEDDIAQSGAGLVVMTSHGRGGVGRMVLGNVADQLVHRLHVPVLVLRPEEKKKQEGSTLETRRILVPLDGSAVAGSILEQAIAFARLTESELLLLSVVQPIPILMPPFVWPPELLTESPEHRELETRRYLEDIKKEIRAVGLKAQSRVRTSPKVAREILRVAREDHCDMIAMATHGASGLDRLMLGSVADQVVRHADIPVLLFRPVIPDQPQAEAPAAEACSLAGR